MYVQYGLDNRGIVVRFLEEATDIFYFSKRPDRPYCVLYLWHVTSCRFGDNNLCFDIICVFLLQGNRSISMNICGM